MGMAAGGPVHRPSGPFDPEGPRRFCAVRAYCRGQNLGAGGIHFRRVFALPKGGGHLRRPEPKTERTSFRMSFLFLNGWSKSIFRNFRIAAEGLPNGPSGPRRFCGVQAFWPQAKALAQGQFTCPEHLESTGWRPPPAAGTQNRKDILPDVLSVLVRMTGLEPVRP